MQQRQTHAASEQQSDKFAMMRWTSVFVLASDGQSRRCLAARVMPGVSLGPVWSVCLFSPRARARALALALAVAADRQSALHRCFPPRTKTPGTYFGLSSHWLQPSCLCRPTSGLNWIVPGCRILQPMIGPESWIFRVPPSPLHFHSPALALTERRRRNCQGSSGLKASTVKSYQRASLNSQYLATTLSFFL